MVDYLPNIHNSGLDDQQKERGGRGGERGEKNGERERERKSKSWSQS